MDGHDNNPDPNMDPDLLRAESTIPAESAPGPEQTQSPPVDADVTEEVTEVPPEVQQASPPNAPPPARPDHGLER